MDQFIQQLEEIKLDKTDIECEKTEMKFPNVVDKYFIGFDCVQQFLNYFQK